MAGPNDPNDPINQIIAQALGGGSASSASPYSASQARLLYFAGQITYEDLVKAAGSEDAARVLLSNPLSADEQQTVTNMRADSANVPPPQPAQAPKAPTAAPATVAGLDVNADAVQLIPGVEPGSTALTESNIMALVNNGQWSAEKAYNTLLLKTGDPQAAADKLNAALPGANFQPYVAPEAAPAQNNGFLGKIEGLGQGLGDVAQAAQTAPAAPAPSYTGDHADFYNTWAPAAQYAQQKYGLDPSIVLAMNASESGWGNAPGFMGFGIKGTGTAGTANLATHEVVNGKSVNVNDNFRQYNSPQEAVDGFMSFLADNSRYAGALANFKKSGDTAQLVKDINAAGYATSPTWADSILSLANTTRQAVTQGAGANGSAAGTSAGGSTTASGTTGGSSAEGVSTDGGWVTGADGQTYYQPPTPKADLTPEQQLALNQQSKLATNSLLKTQEAAGIAAWKQQHPDYQDFGANVVENPKTGDRGTLTFDPSTGQVSLGPAKAITSSVDPYGNLAIRAQNMPLFGGSAPPAPNSALQPNQFPTESQRALYAIDPAARTQAEIAQFGRTLSLPEENAWLGESVGTNQSQDYADLLQARQTMADTGKLPNQFDARNPNSATTQALRLGAGATTSTAQLTPNESSIYATDPGLFTGKPDYTVQQGQTQAPGYSLIPSGPGTDQQNSSRIASEVANGALSNTAGMNLSDSDLQAIGKLNNIASQSGGGGGGQLSDIRQDPDYQRGYSDGQAAQASSATLAPPNGSEAYNAGWRDGVNAARQMINEAPQTATGNGTSMTYQPIAFKAPHAPILNPDGTTPVRVQSQGSNLPTVGDTPLPNSGYTPPAPPPPPVATPPPPPEPQKNPNTPVYRFANGGQVMAGMTAQQPMANGFSTPEEIGFYGMKTGKLYAVAGEGKDGIGGKSSPEMINVTPMNGAPSGITAQPSPINLPMTALGSAKYRFSGFK